MFGNNVGNYQCAVRACQHWGDWKRGNGKRESIEKLHWKTRNRHALPNSTFNKNILPVPLRLKLSIRHFATNVVMLCYTVQTSNNINNDIILVFSSFAFSTHALSASPQHSTLHLHEPPEIRQWTINCAQHAYSQLSLRRQRPSGDHRWSD